MPKVTPSVPDPDRVAQELEIRLRHSSGEPGDFTAEGCVVKKGPRAYKTVQLWTFVHPETGEIVKREFRTQTFSAKQGEAGYDFSAPKYNWHCENEEIEALQGFLNGQMPEAGKYRFVRAGFTR